MPLSRFRVLQIGSGIALDYCGKLFSDFGADVVKLEPPEGEPEQIGRLVVADVIGTIPRPRRAQSDQ